MSKVLKIASLIVFVLAVFRVSLPVDPIALGLGLWVGSELVN
jgi:hypothetical protein